MPVPVATCFDYLPAESTTMLDYPPGVRVLVPFGTRRLVGVVTGLALTPAKLPRGGLKRILQRIDERPVLSDDLCHLCDWLGRYYIAPPGEAYFSALPPLLREPVTLQQALAQDRLQRLHPTAGLLTMTDSTLEKALRGARQRDLARQLRDHPEGLPWSSLSSQGYTPTQARGLQARGLATAVMEAPAPAPPDDDRLPPCRATPSPEQAAALAALSDLPPGFHTVLLQGVTGSGKTEVYLQWLDRLEPGTQALVLVPEIALTPQLLQRFQARFGNAVATYHSGQSPRVRLQVWNQAREGLTKVVIGTRSAVFLPFQRLAAIIVDEEHDGSFKQMEQPRYHARDTAVYRAFHQNIPILLGSATPSLESLNNALRGRYRHIVMTQRAGGARPPALHILDIRQQTLEHGLSPALLERITRHIQTGHQVLLFINRRGYAPVLYCPECRWMAMCPQCDARLTYHQQAQQLRCHHCDWRTPVPSVCPQCRMATPKALGQGTERIEDALSARFPEVPVIRFDRDTIRTPEALQTTLQRIRNTRPCILVGTQLLAKGHDFPDLTLVGIVDGDAGLFSADFRATERTLQLILQVAGRAGRAEAPGEVLLQTAFPDHPMIQALARLDYDRVARSELSLRESSGLPPFGALALIRGESATLQHCEAGLTALKQTLLSLAPELQVHGPFPSVMQRKRNLFHGFLWVTAPGRKPLGRGLQQLAEHHRLQRRAHARQFRWLIDVDPLETL